MERGAQPLAHQGRDTDQLVRQLVERMAQAKPQTCSWKQSPQTADRTVKAIGEGAFSLVRWLMRKGCLLKHAVRLGEGGRALRVAVPQMPDHTATDDGGQLDPLAETRAMLCIVQDSGREGQLVVDPHGCQALLSEGTDQAIEGHGRDMANGGTPCQTEAAMGSDQGLAGHLRTHAAIA